MRPSAVTNSQRVIFCGFTVGRMVGRTSDMGADGPEGLLTA
jgi:hypothetical protein